MYTYVYIFNSAYTCFHHNHVSIFYPFCCKDVFNIIFNFSWLSSYFFTYYLSRFGSISMISQSPTPFSFFLCTNLFSFVVIVSFFSCVHNGKKMNSSKIVSNYEGKFLEINFDVIVELGNSQFFDALFFYYN